jgi:signal transduction histidine kinase
VCHSWFNRFRKLLVRYEKLERSFMALNHLAAACGVDVTVNVDPGIPGLLLGVGNRLRQVLTNILGNGETRRGG